MIARAPLRHLLVTALLGGLVLLCLSHAGSRLSRWAEGGAWPAPLELSRHEWIGDRARDAGELGLRLEGLELERGSANELNLFLFRVQHAIVPSVLVRSPRDRTLVVDGARDEGSEALARRLVEDGWADAAAPPEPLDGRDVALADRYRPLRARPDARVRTRPTWIGGLYLALVLLVPPLVALRRGAVPFGLALLGTPCALALATALADGLPVLASVRGPATLLAHAGASALWIRWVTPLQAARPARGAGVVAEPVGGTGFALALATAVLLGGALLVLFAGLSPEGGWDAQAMYNMRARFVLLAEPFLAPFADAEGYRELHPDYPPLIPFAVAGAWRLGDSTWALAPLAVQLELFLGAVVLLAAWARRTGGRLVALAAVALLAVSPLLVERVAAQECDVPLACLFVAGVLCWRLGQVSPSSALARRGAFVSGLLVGAAALVKNEGAVLAAAWTLVVLVQALRAPRIPVGRPAGALAYLGGLVPGAAALVAFKLLVPENDLVGALDPSRASLERAGTIGRAVLPLLWRPQEFKTIFALALVPGALALVLGPARWWRRRRDGVVFEASLAIVLAAAGAAFVAAYLLTPHDLDWHLRTSSRRLLAQLYPLAVVLVLSAASRARAPAPPRSD